MRAIRISDEAYKFLKYKSLRALHRLSAMSLTDKGRMVFSATLFASSPVNETNSEL